MKPGIRKKLFAWVFKKGDSYNHKLYSHYKADLLKDIKGQVVEIGPGSGINFNYLHSEISWFGIEPNEAFHGELIRKANAKSINATLLAGDAEAIPLPDEFADIVVCTLVLCSVPNPTSAIEEMKRVLKPKGKLIFIEHVSAPAHSTLRSFQDFFNPINQLMADGCNCNRETWLSLEQAGFQKVEITHFKIDAALKLHAPHILGYAIK